MVIKLFKLMLNTVWQHNIMERTTTFKMFQENMENSLHICNKLVVKRPPLFNSLLGHLLLLSQIFSSIVDQALFNYLLADDDFFLKSLPCFRNLKALSYEP